MRPILFLLLVLASFVVLASQASAQTFGIQYGPRAFWIAPIGTNAINLKYEELSAYDDINGRILEGFEIGTTSVIASYTTYFDFFGQSASFLGAVAPVQLEGDLETAFGTISVFEEKGISDPYFQFYTTLIGGEAKSLQEFATTEPGFILGAFAAARPPMGDYSQTKLANPGANRWEWRFGVPVQYIWGLPTQQTSIEFVPTVYLFGHNDDLFGGGTLNQDPFYQFEAHITHDINKIFWGSLNILHGFGGETSVDGVGQDDAIAYTSGGFTLGARLSRTFSISGSYGQRLWSDQSDNDGSWFSISVTATF